MLSTLEQVGNLDDDTVVVVGFGPVGAVAALALGRRGVSVVVLEAEADISDDPRESRASTFHPPTLEMLADLGVVDALHATGLISATYQYRDRRDGVVAHFDLGVLAADTPFPYRLQSEQANLVRIVRDRLVGMDNVRLVSGAQVGALRLEDGNVGLTVRQGERTRDITSRWVLAADGSNSVARRDGGIAFDGMTYPERFLVISTTTDLADLIPDIANVNYISDPEEWLVLLRTPRHWRVLFPVADHDDLAALVEPTAIEKRLQSVVPYAPGYEVSHTTIYNVHQRVASTFRQGGLLLAGDAAHINNPLGGMGMNSGIHDAMAAVEALVGAIGGRNDGLEAYSASRRSFALDTVQRATHRNWQTMKERDPEVRAAHHAELARTAEDPVLAREYLLKTSMLASALPS